jgi:PhzF family phenazine biosynthesis protein
VRFFTPTCEVPSCSHATTAAHYVRAKKPGITGVVRQLCGAGVLSIESTQTGNDCEVYMRQAMPEFLDVYNNTIPEILDALGLSNDPLDRRCPVEVVSTGHSKVLIGVRDSDVLNALSPGDEHRMRISKSIGCNGYFLFTLHPDDLSHFSEARMFAPAIGIKEDPVTGNGNGPLGAYLVRHGLVLHHGSVVRFTSLQGRAMGRPGVAEVEVQIANGNPVSVKVGKDAGIAFEFDLTV